MNQKAPRLGAGLFSFPNKNHRHACGRVGKAHVVGRRGDQRRDRWISENSTVVIALPACENGIGRAVAATMVPDQWTAGAGDPGRGGDSATNLGPPRCAVSSCLDHQLSGIEPVRTGRSRSFAVEVEKGLSHLQGDPTRSGQPMSPAGRSGSFGLRHRPMSAAA